MMIDDRLTGATIISRRNPSSRSHTSEEALKIPLSIAAMHRTPGKMNVLKSTPSVEAADSVCRPEPRTSRNSSGWISHITICMRSPVKRMSSRRQTIFTARSSECHERSGTRTGDDVGNRGAHRRAPASARIMTRVWSLTPVSASRIVVPV